MSRGRLGGALGRMYKEGVIFIVNPEFGPGGLKPSKYYRSRSSAIAAGVKEKMLPRITYPPREIKKH
jgi:hypothetical protein